jgi:DNA-binding transcriptional ArsR family regulator
MNEHRNSDLHGESLFSALGDRQRQKILRALRRREMPAGEVAELLAVRPATVSHHLSVLKRAGLVRVRKDGQRRIYAINLSVFEEAVMLLSTFLGTREKIE